MTLAKLKALLEQLQQITFQLPNGTLVPHHFHVTEVGKVSKHFIDCGGTVRKEEVVSLQLWNANDYDHRLHPEKLVQIIELSEQKLGLENLEIQVEYQGETTLEIYNLDFNGEYFTLIAQQTACLAEDACGIPQEKLKVNLADLKTKNTGCCPPGCC